MSLFIVILIWISLISNDVEHLFRFLFAICIYSLVMCLFKSSAQLLLRIFVLYYWVLKGLYLFWIHDLFSEMCFANNFSRYLRTQPFPFLCSVTWDKPHVQCSAAVLVCHLGSALHDDLQEASSLCCDPIRRNLHSGWSQDNKPPEISCKMVIVRLGK